VVACGTCKTSPPAAVPVIAAAINPIEPFAKNSRRERAIPNPPQTFISN
jgi:hypothetical protein